jgi:hypothetical protein
LASCLVAALTDSVSATCLVGQDKKFSGESVLLARDGGLSAGGNFAVFRAPLAVNTDGAPNSYSPDDFLGRTKAINRFDNGISIRYSRDNRKVPAPERYDVFKKWRDSGWNVPAGYKIFWGNVIATRDGKPCVFGNGPNKGYFGSLTALKNGLATSQAGECEVKDQLNQTQIPAIVLRGDSNPLRHYGASVGDLVVAVNPRSGVLVNAIIGDTGDGDRIGEGSVALNMALLGKTKQPKNYETAKELDTDMADMVIAVLPGTKTFRRVRPYSAENIQERIKQWADVEGYGSVESLKNSILSCAGRL